MSVTGSCGHLLTEEEGFGRLTACKDYDREGNKAISYRSLCNKCYQMHHAGNQVLRNKYEEEKWLKRK